jgi:DNA-binding CsgD family transcriptional regulator
MTQISYTAPNQFSKNWSYRTSVQRNDRTIMNLPAAPHWSGLELIDRLYARSDWVDACEAAIEVRGVAEFLGWMERYVRPLIGYRFMACGTGVFLARSVSVDRLLLRGVQSGDAERLRDEDGTVILPRAQSRGSGGLHPVDIGPLTARVWVNRQTNLSPPLTGRAMERNVGVRQRGSYFLFGASNDAVRPVADYGMRLLAPHMHDALLGVLANEREHVDERDPIRLSRAERILLEYLAAGRTSADIARETFRSVHTVSNQMRTILIKLRAKNRTEAISKALGLGLVASVDRAPVTRITAAQPRATYFVVGVVRIACRYRIIKTVPTRSGRYYR